MLTAAENLAIHLALVFALPAEKAAQVAGALPKAVSDAVQRIGPCLRGRVIPFDQYLSESPAPDRDSFRLDKEVQLAQLQHQHEDCLRAWTITADHAIKVAEYERNHPMADSGPPKKPYVGDLRFLQLAKHIRREMDKVELAIAKHLEELKESDNTAWKKSEPTLEKVAETPIVQVEPNPTEYAASKATPSKLLPALTAARVATVQTLFGTDAHPVSPSQKPIYKPREIPTIAAPPRKKDKYSGVNR